MIFETRYKAGEYLSTALRNKFQDFHGNILVGILKGGLPVTYQVARELRISTTFLVVKKLLKNNTMFGLITQNGIAAYNRKAIDKLVLNTKEIKAIEKEAFEEAKYEKEKYGLYFNDFAGKTTIVVDDGIYTGFTVATVAKDLKQKGVAKLILAVPVANSTVLKQLQTFYDEIICLEQAEDKNFYYQNTIGVTIALLQKM